MGYFDDEDRRMEAESDDFSWEAYELRRMEAESIPSMWMCEACGKFRCRTLCHRYEVADETGTWYETVCEDCIDR